MLTIVEKVIFLQEVDIFSEIPTEQLAYVAAVVEEEQFTAGQNIYQAKDPADAMYLVVEGQVQLQDDTTTVDYDPGNDFGTWALLTDEPRDSSATPSEDTRLLRLHKEDFTDLLAENVEITQGVLKALAHRAGLLKRMAARLGKK